MAFTSGQVVNAADLNDLDINTLTTSGTVTIGGFSLPAVDGTADQVLVTNGSGTVTWQDAAGGSPGGSDGYIQYNNGGAFGGASALYYDDVNSRVGVNTTAPRWTLDVIGDIQASGGAFIAGDAGGGSGGTNIDHIYHNDGANTWHFCSDTTYKNTGNSNLQAGTLNLSGAMTAGGNITGVTYYSTSNGAGTNYRVGDDCWIGDVNVTNTIRLTGVQNSDRAYLQFGNSGQKLGQIGTGYLTWSGGMVVSGYLQGSSVVGAVMIGANGTDIYGTGGRNYFKDSEKSSGNGLRVGAAWSKYGIYSESGDVVIGAATGKVSIQNDLAYFNSNGLYLSNGDWFRTVGSAGWYSETHNGGWYMIDATWVRSYQNKSVYTGSGNLRTDGQLQVPNMSTTTTYNTVRWKNDGSGQLLVYSSTADIKEDVVSITPIMEYLNERSLIHDLRPVLFHEKDQPDGTNNTRGEYIPGLIAEEVLDVAPELCFYNENGDLISYGNDHLIPHLIAEIQRLMPMVEEMYGATHPDWVAPSPRPVERASDERQRFDEAAAAQALVGRDDISDPLDGQRHLGDETDE